MSRLVLWHFPVSHFNEKARWALEYKGIAYQRVPLGATYLPRAWWKTRQGSLPILLLEDGRAVADSTRIIAELERLHPEPALYPADPAERERALELEDWFDEAVGHPVRTWILGDLWEQSPEAAFRLLSTGMEDTLKLPKPLLPLMRRMYLSRHSINTRTRAVARERVFEGFERIQRELGPSGYLVGERFSVADLAAAAILAPLVRPAGLEFPPPLEALPEAIRKDFEALSEHPSSEWLRGIYARHRGGPTPGPAPLLAPGS
jgi:glutathione S-transferase